MANLTRGTDNWTLDLALDAQSKTLTLGTADKYVDKDIELDIAVRDGAGSISGGALTHGGITTTDKTYLTGTSTNGYKVTMSNQASVGAISVPISTAGWIDNGDIASKAATSADTVSTDFYVKKGSASVSSSQSIPVSGSIKNNGGTLTANFSGSKSITGSATAGWVTGVTAATVQASGSATAEATDLDANLVEGNIVKGKTIFGVTGTGGNATKASFANAATEGKTYTDISADAPVLISGSYLFIDEGYVDGNKKISLAQLVPDGSNVIGNEELIYNTVSVYNKNGELVAGTMGDATVKSGAPSLSGTPSVGAQNSSTKKYPLTASISVAAPSVSTGGYITSAKGTKSSNSGNVVINLDAATCTIAGGGLTAGDGTSSIAANGYVKDANGTLDANDAIALATTSAAGYYKITSSGSGSVSRAAVTDTHTAGWLPAKSASNAIAAASLSSKTGTTAYYIKKSTGASQSWAPKKDSAQSVTISAGYYPTDRTISVSKVDPTNANQVAQGALSANDSAISSISASVGMATVDTTNNKYNIPLSLSASGTAYAKVSTVGYVTTSKNTSKALSKTGSATVSLDLYDGTYTLT